MGKDLHLYTNGQDPFTFAWDDVTFHVHVGTQATPEPPVSPLPPQYVPDPQTHVPVDLERLLGQINDADRVEIYVPEPESLRPMEDILTQAAGRSIILGTTLEGVGELVKPVVEGLSSGPQDASVHVWHDDRD